MLSKIASIVRTSGGRLTSETQTLVTMPSVPSEPQEDAAQGPGPARPAGARRAR